LSVLLLYSLNALPDIGVAHILQRAVEYLDCEHNLRLDIAIMRDEWRDTQESNMHNKQIKFNRPPAMQCV
jgi:hypothetical protein